MISRMLTAAYYYLRTPPGEVPRNVSQAIYDEIETHLALSIRDRSVHGISEQDSCRRAFEEFGPVTDTILRCHQVWYAHQNICHRVHLMLTAVLLVAVGYWFINRGSETQPASPVVTGDLRGRVGDEHFRPIAQAHILAVVKTWPPNGFRQQAYMTTTGSDGEFRIDDAYPTDQLYEVQLAVVADDRLLESKYVSDGMGQLEPFAFTLEPSEPIVLRFQEAGGRAVEGIEVFPHRRVDSNGHGRLVYFCSADPIVKRSNADGLVRLPYFHDGDQATLYYRVPGRDWQTRDVVIPHDTRQLVLELEAAESKPSSPPKDRGA